MHYKLVCFCKMLTGSLSECVEAYMVGKLLQLEIQRFIVFSLKDTQNKYVQVLPGSA